MEIKRNGKTFRLTTQEKRICYEEVREEIWRGQIKCSIEDNIGNLRFSDGYPIEAFIFDCVGEILDRINHRRKDYEEYDDIVFSVAEQNDVWEDD